MPATAASARPTPSDTADAYRLTAFGLEIEADFPLTGARTHPRRHSPHALALTHERPAELAPLSREPRAIRYARTFDNCPYAMLEGSDGDILFDYRPRALFHLSADRSILRCAPTAGADRSWERVLLDTVLWTTSLVRGFELLHASAVETALGDVAFVAVSGGGKTSLAAEQVSRGGRLLSDDILALEGLRGRVVSHPGPPLMNLPGQIDASGLGNAEVIARFGDEQWVWVEGPPVRPRPLGAIVFIHRAPGEPAQCSRIDATGLTLLSHSVIIPHVGDRAKSRFELFADLATATPVLRLSADPSVATTELTDLVEQGLAAL